MYALSYRRLFWAMIIIIFDFNLGPINVLPNCIGYILTYFALNELQNQHEIYKKGKTPAILLTLLTLKDIIVSTNSDNLLIGKFAPVNFGLMALGTLVMLINIYLIYIVCKGIYLLSIERDLEDVKKSTKARWKAFLVISVIMLFYMPFSLNISVQAKEMMIVFVIVNVIVQLLIAFLFKKSAVYLEG